MTAVGVERRAFDAARDAHRHVYLTDGVRLFEVVGVRGFNPGGLAKRPDRHAALKLIDARQPVPAHPFDELEAASWHTPTVLVQMLVVVPG